MNIHFKEEQKFVQWWHWLILLPIGALPIIGIYKQLIRGETFGEKPFSTIGLVLVSILIFAIIGLFLIIKLTTSIDKNGIQMSFFPFLRKTISWTDVKTLKVIDYGFVGGWGIRLWTKYGTVYNIKGNKGLAIELKNGRKLLIGTQRENELNRLLRKTPLE